MTVVENLQDEFVGQVVEMHSDRKECISLVCFSFAFLIEVFRIGRIEYFCFFFFFLLKICSLSISFPNFLIGLYLDVRQDTLLCCVLGIDAVERGGDQLAPTPPLGLS